MVADGVVCWSKGHAPPFERMVHWLIQVGGHVEHAAAAASILILPAIVELDKAVEGVDLLLLWLLVEMEVDVERDHLHHVEMM